MKILIFNTLYFPYKVGGAEVSVQILAEGLVKHGHQVRVVSLHPKPKREIAKNNGVEVVYLPLANVYWPFDSKKKNKFKKMIWHFLDTANVFMMKRVVSELDNFKPDVVHTNNISGFSVLLWKKVKNRNIRLIHTARDYYLFHPNSTLFKNGKNMDEKSISVFLWSFFKKKYSNYVDSFIGISDFVIKLHKDNGFFEKSNAVCIYNPVPVPIFKDEGIVEGKTRVGFIGRLSQEKGFDEFCNIAKKYTSKDISFVAAGSPNSGEDIKKIKKMAIENNVALLGFISLELFLSKVDIVIFPIQWREPFGRVIVECVVSGKVVFSNYIGGITELSSFLNIHDLKNINFKCDLYDYSNELSIFEVDKHISAMVDIYEKI